ncbi:hypothetical protein ACFVY4_25380 [Streptomyces sp. NPDC058299]|uniref:hypothetical protein n=1 Tax=Streptomyces sp. NPDC058299 TaxID=3346435 RepID=UPI0036E62ABC
MPFSGWYTVTPSAQRACRIAKVPAVSGISLAESAEVTQYTDNNGTTDHVGTLIDDGDGDGDGTVRVAKRDRGKVWPSTAQAPTKVPTSSSTRTTAPRTAYGGPPTEGRRLVPSPLPFSGIRVSR